MVPRAPRPVKSLLDNKEVIDLARPRHRSRRYSVRSFAGANRCGDRPRPRSRRPGASPVGATHAPSTYRRVGARGQRVTARAGPCGRSAVRRYLSSGPPVAESACALYLTVLSLNGERPCFAHAAINSCRGLGESTEPPKVTPPYAFGSTTTPSPHNGHSAFGERTTSGTSHSRRHSLRMLNGQDCTSRASTHDSPLGSATDRQIGRAGQGVVNDLPLM